MTPINFALTQGFSNDSILQNLIRHFPHARRQIEKAVAKGFTADKIVKYLQGGRQEVNSPESMTEHEQARSTDKERKQNIKSNIGKGALALGATALGGYALSRALPRASTALQGELLPAEAQPLQLPNAIEKLGLPGPQQGMPQQPPITPNPQQPNTPQPQQPTQAQPPINPQSVPAPTTPLPPLLQDLAKKSFESGNNIDQVSGLLQFTQPKAVKDYEKATGQPIAKALEDFAGNLPSKPMAEAPSITKPVQPVSEIPSAGVNEELQAEGNLIENGQEKRPQEQPNLQPTSEKLDVLNEAPKRPEKEKYTIKETLHEDEKTGKKDVIDYAYYDDKGKVISNFAFKIKNDKKGQYMSVEYVSTENKNIGARQLASLMDKAFKDNPNIERIKITPLTKLGSKFLSKILNKDFKETWTNEKKEFFLNKKDFSKIKDFTTKISYLNSSVALPNGDIGEITDIRQGIATVEANGKKFTRKIDELENEPEGLDEAVRHMMSFIPENEKSTALQTATHLTLPGMEGEEMPLLLTQFYDGRMAWYLGVTEQDYNDIALGTYEPKGEKKTSIGEYKPGVIDSRGAAFHEKIRMNPKYSKENKGKTWGYANNGYGALHAIQPILKKMSREELDEEGKIIQKGKREVRKSPTSTELSKPQNKNNEEKKVKKKQSELIFEMLEKANEKKLKLDEKIIQENRNKSIDPKIRSQEIKQLDALEKRINDLRKDLDEAENKEKGENKK